MLVIWLVFPKKPKNTKSKNMSKEINEQEITTKTCIKEYINQLNTVYHILGNYHLT